LLKMVTLRHALFDLLRGRANSAITQIEKVVSPAGSDEDADKLNHAATIQLHLGRYAEAYRTSQRARVMAGNRDSAPFATFQAVLARSLMKDPPPEDPTPTLRHFVEMAPSGTTKAYLSLVEAIDAVERGDGATALEALKRVDPLTPPGIVGVGGNSVIPQTRVTLWYYRGRAHLIANQLDDAEKDFSAIVNSGYRRLFMPIEYVRSFYYLGQIAEKKGEPAKAREQYAKFLGYWKDGDIDRDKVDEAIRKTR